MRAGHLYLELGNNSLSNTTVTIPGVYEHIESNYRKQVILHNLVISDTEYADAGVVFGVDDSDFVASFYAGDTLYTLTVTSDDEVTCTAAS